MHGISYRAVGPKVQGRARGRVAVEVELRNQGTMTWTPSGAALVGSKHEELTGLTVWPLEEPIPPGKSKRIVVELNATEREARGIFMLKLWGGQDGAEGLALDGVTFP